MQDQHSSPAVPAQPAAEELQATARQARPEGNKPADDYQVHAAAAIFPPMRETEFDALVADMREQGQLEALWTFNGQVIDGRHRLRACKILGLAPRTREWDGQGSLTEFIVSTNLRRRHLKENQRAMVAARMMPHFEEEALKRKNAGVAVGSDLSLNLSQGKTARLVGEMLNISCSSVEFARKLIQRGVPDLIARVDLGKLAVSTAAKVAEFPPEEQTRLLSLSKPELLKALRPAAAAPPAPVVASTPEPEVSPVRCPDVQILGERGYVMRLSPKRWREELHAATSDSVFESVVHVGLRIFVG